jgi:hypothetical protein
MTYIYQSASGWELEILTSSLNNEKLRDAIQFITGERYPFKSYATRAEAEAVEAQISDAYQQMVSLG